MAESTSPAAQDKWSAERYNHTASFVYSKEFTSPVLSLLDAKPGERIIDFGCGTGELAVQLQKFVGEHGVVAGVDASTNMVSAPIACKLPEHLLTA